MFQFITFHKNVLASNNIVYYYNIVFSFYEINATKKLLFNLKVHSVASFTNNHRKISFTKIGVNFFSTFFLPPTIFVNILNSRVVIKPVVSGILFSISMTFVLREALATRLVISGILTSISVAFILRARLLISGILFSISSFCIESSSIN